MTFDRAVASPRREGEGPATSLLTSTRAAVATAAVGGALMFALIHTGMTDDGWITLDYARTLARDGQWGMVPGYPGNTATSPLNVLLLGALTAIVGSPVIAAGVLYVAACAVLAGGLEALGKVADLGPRVTWLALPVLVLNPFITSALGLESMLVVAALPWAAAAALRGSPWMFGLVAGLLMLLRPDLAVLVGVLFVATPALLRRAALVLGAAASVLVPWLTFSWVVLGSVVPDTLIIKQGQNNRFPLGLLTVWWRAYPLATASALLIVVLGAASVVSWHLWRRGPADRIVPALFAAGAAYYLLMCLLQLQAFFWYYVPSLAAMTLAVAVAGARVMTGPPERPVAGRLVVAGAVAVTLLAAVPWAVRAAQATPVRTMAVHGNWAYPGEYARVARDLRSSYGGSTPVRSAGEVGALVYFCDCPIADKFTDRSWLAAAIEDRREHSALWSLNYHFLDVSHVPRMEPRLRLVWQPGPDRSHRDWQAHGVRGLQGRGHFTMLPCRSPSQCGWSAPVASR